MWITFGSVHEVRAFRERKKRSVWFSELLELFKGLEVIYYREEFNISTLVGRKVF